MAHAYLPLNNEISKNNSAKQCSESEGNKLLNKNFHKFWRKFNTFLLTFKVESTKNIVSVIVSVVRPK